ncbi:uncharacterized protein STEHIDRAFT_142622 [Stereum hirsutum FP-91666 SS1]|uniref:uncharacterized protein n=1 Tax=Stereum hirsutum (strain FP-91666) TaxID=721885 RepID=UPI00044494C8|nr:uncharacterized protein STEHIDRAFT_142622 [Stereum hirsutum FP-91666 SS1]EIM80699.1 hypothetical protein STEHIDRAFT_142622 [Stereum hirsutum FP-91666 SS1]
MPSASSSDMHSASADGVDYPLAPDDRTRDAVHTIVSGRKSWKTLKGKGEAVWPPYLEAALVEALDRYRPETSRSTRSLSRFPNRNRFISDYIFHVTGKRRTAKQVGSRLQQLRDTCGGKRILKLLSNRDFSSIDDSLESSSPSHGSPDHIASSTLIANGSLQPIIKPSRALVHIDVLPANAYWCPSPSSSLSDALSGVIGSGGIVTPPLSPSSTHHNRHSSSNGGNPASGAVSVFKSSKARPLRAIDPTVTFTSTTLMDTRSSCSVYFNGNCIHTESTEMHCSSLQENVTSSYMYRASLVPQFWVRLCDSNEPGRYSIVQEIIQASTGSSPTSEHVLLTVVYQLTEPITTTTTASSSSSPSYAYGDGGDCTSPAPSSRSSNSGSGGSRSSSGSGSGSGMMSPVDMLGRNTTFELLPCNTSSFMNAVNDLPITPVSATFSDHPGSGPHPNSHSHSHPHPAHHLSTSGPGFSRSHSHSGPLGHSHSHSGSLGHSHSGSLAHSLPSGGLATLGDDAYFPSFDDMSSFGTISSDYTTFGGGLGVGGGIGQWGGGGYSPASSFE